MSSNDSAIVSSRRPLLGPGVAWGAAGVLAFSLTFPATRAALPAFGPVTVGIGRAVPAAAIATVALVIARSPFPTPAQVRRLGLVSIGVVVGFPVCSSLALRDATSAHGAVLIGLLPAATAAVSVWRGGERVPRRFWLGCGVGTSAVVAFALVQGGGQVGVADLWLLVAVVLGALGYAEGGRLARELGGWQVIAWALIFSSPVVVPVAVIGLNAQPVAAPSTGAWIGVLYVSVVSMFAGFFAWYRGLATGGVARISQLQLAQPVLTVGWSVLLLGEHVGVTTVVAGAAVIGATGLALRSAPPVTAQPRCADRPSR
jgi:drug/metabolite transporter (DMT)-like permease